MSSREVEEFSTTVAPILLCRYDIEQDARIENKQLRKSINHYLYLCVYVGIWSKQSHNFQPVSHNTIQRKKRSHVISIIIPVALTEIILKHQNNWICKTIYLFTLIQ